MSTRRKFIQNSLLGAMAVGSSEFWANPFDSPGRRHNKGAFPVVIATWNNRKANEAAWDVLRSGGRALDAVEAGVRVPEADPEDTSVGYGGFPDRDGIVTLDACIMDELGMAGSVCCLEDIMHPISVARRVMEKTPHVMLVGEGAYRFAIEEGFKKENLLTDKARRAWEEWKIKSDYKPKVNFERHDTIGMVAIDSQHRIAGACTTSGMAFKMHGRVGDSPIIGAGMYVDNEVGGAAATGLGEMVLRTLGSFLIVETMRRGVHPQKATEQVIKRLVQKYPEQAAAAQVGYIAVDKKGRYGAYSVHPGFNFVVYQKNQLLTLEAGSLLRS